MKTPTIELEYIYAATQKKICDKILDGIGGRGEGLLVISSSSFRSRFLANAAEKKHGGKAPLNVTFTTPNGFVENFPETALEQPCYTISIEEKRALVFSILKEKSPLKKISLSHADLFLSAISEIKSNAIDASTFLKLSSRPGASVRCMELAPIFQQYEKALETAKVRDYESKVHCMLYDREAFDAISENYGLLIIESLPCISPVEIKLLARLMQAVKKVKIAQVKLCCDDDRIDAAEILNELESQGCRIALQPENPPEPVRGDTACEKNGRRYATRALTEGAISLLSFKNESEEVENIARFAKTALLKAGGDGRGIGIFIPSPGLYKRPLEAAFKKYGLPYATNEGCLFSEHRHGRSLLALLNFLKKPSVSSLMETFMSAPIAEFEKKRDEFNFREIRNCLLKSKIFSENGGDDGLKKLASLLETEETGTQTASAMHSIFSFLKAYSKTVKKNAAAIEDHWRDTLEFMDAAGCDFTKDLEKVKTVSFAMGVARDFIKSFSSRFKKYIDFSEYSEIIYDFVSSIYVPPEFDGTSIDLDCAHQSRIIAHTKNNIALFNFDYIIIAGLNEECFPSGSSGYGLYFDAADRERLGLRHKTTETANERRLFHELLGAADEGAVLTMAAGEMDKKKTPSRFLGEISNHSNKFPLIPENILCDADVFRIASKLTDTRNFTERLAGHGLISAGELESNLNSLRASENALRQRRENFSGAYCCDLSACPGDDIVKAAFSMETSPSKNMTLGPTTLEKYLYCPASFYFERLLDLKFISRYVEEIEPFEEGKIIHALLQQLFDSRGIACEFKDYILSADPQARDAIRKRIESEFWELSRNNAELMKLKKFGDFYFKMKLFQYFNKLEGFKSYYSDAADSFISGHFKRFIDDYLQFVSSGCAPMPAGVEVQSSGIEIPTVAGIFTINAKCDRLDMWLDDAAGKAYFIIFDYKTGRVPDENDIKSHRKIQAPFYLYIFNREFNENRIKSKEIGRIIKNAGPNINFSPAGFVYHSITGRGANGKSVKKFFISSEFASSSAPKEGIHEFKLITRSGKFEHEKFEAMIDDIPALICDCVKKISAGRFHQSLNKKHDCGICDFNSICHRCERAVLNYSRTRVNITNRSQIDE